MYFSSNFGAPLIEVLLENVAQTGVEILTKEGYQVKTLFLQISDLTVRLNSTKLPCRRTN